MTIWWLALVVLAIVAGGIGFIWLVVRLNHLGGGVSHGDDVDTDRSLNELAEEETSHLFNKEFREELRNRGRLRFESIINENAMFLKQDLELTTSQLNEYMKSQIAAKIDDEFNGYARAMKDLQELAKESLQKAAGEVEEQRATFSKTLEKDVSEQKAARLEAYEKNMARVIEHYVSQALGDQFDLKAQLPYIISQMEANKKDIIEDMKL